jgi:hypothetical protein
MDPPNMERTRNYRYEFKNKKISKQMARKFERMPEN